MTYKLIKECGIPLQSRYNETHFYVAASDLEAFLAKGVRVYEQYEKPSANYWSAEQSSKDTHQALLINIREIPKLEPVSKEEIIKQLIRAKDFENCINIDDLISRIEKAGIR